MCQKQVRVEYLTDDEKKNTRSLWEEIFTEDTREFLDYYYSEKTRENQVLAVKEGSRIISMLHLNPYRLQLSGKSMHSYYIVAVATRPEYRHQGYMGSLLLQALKQAEQEGCPFLFLMPAKEAIYQPFDFVTVYEQGNYILEELKVEKISDNQQVLMEILAPPFQEHGEILPLLPEIRQFYQNILSHRFDIYAMRDDGYLQEILLEQQSQKGGMILFRKKESRELVGIGYYTREEELQLRELLCYVPWEEAVLQKLYTSGFCQGQVKIYGADFQKVIPKVHKKIPCIMVRLTNLSSLHGCLALENVSEDNPFQEHNIKLVDRLLSNQQGIYHLFELKRGNKSFLGIQRVAEQDPYQETLDVEEFTKKYIKNQKIFLNEVV